MKGLAVQHKVHKEMMIRLLNIAGALTYKQLLSMTKLSPSVLNTLITQLQRENKLVHKKDWVALNEAALENKQSGIYEVMWIFNDFLPRAEYYTHGEYPAVICFFADGKEYEIIYVPLGQEYIISKSVTDSEDPPKRLIAIENTDQIEKISISNISAYCITEQNGHTKYYKRKEEVQ